MKAPALADLLGPFAMLTNRNALTTLYKTLVISPTAIRAYSPWGALEADLELGNKKTIFVDAAQFIGVMKSLPSRDLELTIKGTALEWQCGSADGRLALVAGIESPEIDFGILRKKLWSPNKAFVEALELGALSCGPESMSSAGAYGALLRFDEDRLVIASSDSITISVVVVDYEYHADWPASFTLKPEAIDMLAEVLRHDAGTAKPNRIHFEKQTMYARAGDYRLMLKAAPPLKQDIIGMADNYVAHEVTTPIPEKQITAFIKRVTALTESKAHAYITMSIDKGRLLFSFSEGSSDARDMYKMADGLDVAADLPDIRLDASRMARVLAHASTLVLDHIDRDILVFHGDKDNPQFEYYICGVAKNEKRE